MPSDPSSIHLEYGYGSSLGRQTPDDVIYNALVEAARRGRRCPTNGELAHLIGAQSASTSVTVLARLSRAGKVIVYSGNNQRVVDIPAFGIGTVGLMPGTHWRERRGQPLTTHARPSREEPTPEPIERDVAAKKLTALEIEERVVSRDPCPKCGVRGDIGCKHQRVG